MEQQRELANNRLHELEKLNLEYQSSIKQIEKLKAEVGGEIFRIDLRL